MHSAIKAFFFSVPTAKHFILKMAKNNLAYVSLIIVPADSPSLSSLLFSVLFLVAPRIPHVRVCHFLSCFLPLSLLFGSAAAPEDAWHLGIICTQEDHTKGTRAQQRVDRRKVREGINSIVKRTTYLLKINFSARIFVLDVAAAAQTAFHVSGNDQVQCSEISLSFILGLHNIQFFYRHRNINLRNKHIAKDCNTTLGQF